MTIDAVLDDLAPVGLDELNAAAALTHRLDTKYVVRGSVVERLLTQGADAYRVLEIDGGRRFRYRSDYLDSPDLLTFRSHLQRRRRRYKLRFRHYVESGALYYEVKLKDGAGRTVKKRRLADADEPDVARPVGFFTDVVAAAYATSIPADLSFVCQVTYTRSTLLAAAGRERLTLDHGISFHNLVTGQRVSLPDDIWIVETKTVSARSTSNHVLLRAGARPVSVSKYVLGLSMTRPTQAPNDYRPLLRRIAGCVGGDIGQSLGQGALASATSMPVRGLPSPVTAS